MKLLNKRQRAMRTTLTATFMMLASAVHATAGELFFRNDNQWVVFQGPMLSEEVDGILSKLEDRNPKLILLDSIGGNVSGAIRFARYVREKNMNTRIIKNQTCASACALVFLAGVERFSEGKLIVHQYFPTAGHGYAKVTWDTAFIGVQWVIGEIITLLNSFGTPPFVFERIFSSPDVYEFTEAEMAEITTVTSLDEM